LRTFSGAPVTARPSRALALVAYMSMYSCPDNSMILYMISSVTARRMSRSLSIPSYREKSSGSPNFTVGDAKVSGQPLLFEIRARQIDGRRGEIDADDAGAALGEARQIHACAAADFEHAASAIAVEVHQAQQVVQLLEMVLVEVVEESARADRVFRDLEVVDVLVPVLADAIDRRDVLCRGHRRPLYYRGWLRR